MTKTMFTTFAVLFCGILYAQPSFIERTFSSDDFEFLNEIKVADLNGDNLLDIVSVGQLGHQITVAYNRDNNQTLDLHFIDTEFDIVKIELLDFDGDGAIDILGSAPFEDAGYWWKNMGTGNFERQELNVGEYEGIHLADINNDNQLEVLMGINDQLIAYQVENGMLNQLAIIDQGGFAFTTKAITTFDKNNDQLMDVLAADAFDGIFLYEQQNDGSFQRTELLPDVKSVEYLEVTDFNSDGNYDILASSTFNGTSKILINNGDDTFVESQVPTTIERVDFAFLADYDRDGDDDIVYYDNGFGEDGIINAYENSGGMFTSLEISKNFPRIKFGLAGDLNGDQNLELIFIDNSFFDRKIVILEQDSSTSILQTPTFEVAIAPTLLSNYLNIQSQELLNYQIFNTLGHLIDQGQAHYHTSIDASQWLPGMYFIELRRADSVIVRQVVTR